MTEWARTGDWVQGGAQGTENVLHDLSGRWESVAYPQERAPIDTIGWLRTPWRLHNKAIANGADTGQNRIRNAPGGSPRCTCNIPGLLPAPWLWKVTWTGHFGTILEGQTVGQLAIFQSFATICWRTGLRIWNQTWFFSRFSHDVKCVLTFAQLESGCKCRPKLWTQVSHRENRSVQKETDRT